MTFPTISARTSSETTSNSGTHSVSLGSPSAGELIVVISSFDETPDFIYPDPAVSGTKWHRSAIVYDSGAASLASVVHWKIAEGSDALTLISETAEQCSHFAIRISGHASAVALASANGSSTNADPPNVAITGAAQDVLFIAASCQDAQVVASAAPTGYANLTTKAATNIAGASISIADKTANANSDNPGAFTTATEQWVAWAIAIPSVAITTNTRPTQLAVEASSATDPAMRATALAVEAISANLLTMLTTQLCVESLSANVLTMLSSQFCVEVISADDTVPAPAEPSMLFIAT
jgi:hypothetical protein